MLRAKRSNFLLSGAHEPTLGEIELEGSAVTLARPVEAQRLGVETVYQDLSLISAFTAAENVFLGHRQVTERGARAASRSSTILKLRGNRKYSQTACSMTSAGNRWPR